MQLLVEIISVTKVFTIPIIFDNKVYFPTFGCKHNLCLFRKKDYKVIWCFLFLFCLSQVLILASKLVRKMYFCISQHHKSLFYSESHCLSQLVVRDQMKAVPIMLEDQKCPTKVILFSPNSLRPPGRWEKEVVLSQAQWKVFQTISGFLVRGVRSLFY